MHNFKIMGVLNVTPDSFSDGGKTTTAKTIESSIVRMIEEGVDVIDIGAESTRPGAQFVDEAEEVARLNPLRALLPKYLHEVTFSVDTRRPTTFELLADSGATIFNNVKGLANLSEISTILQKFPSSEFLAMHWTLGDTPAVMQSNPDDNPKDDVAQFFARTHRQLRELGVNDRAIWLDPGIGFGKSDRANIQLMAECANWSKRYNVVVGISRKSIFHRQLNLEDPISRDPATKVAELALALCGVRMLRTHEVKTLARLRSLLT